MGYYSRFHLTWQVDPCPKPVQRAGEVARIVAGWIEENDEARIALNRDGLSEDRAKWYECQHDLRHLSLKLRDVLFIMECKGEDAAKWRWYVKGGIAHRVEPILVWKVPKFS